MLLWISWFVSGMITVGSAYYIFSTVILKKKITFKLSDIAILAIYSAVNTFVIIYGSRSIRFPINLATAFFSMLIIFRQTPAKTLITIFLIYLIYGVVEIIYVLLFSSIISKDPNLLVTNIPYIIISNLIICLVAVALFHIRILCKAIKNVINWYSENDFINSIVIVVLTTLVVFAFMDRNMNFNSNLKNIIINVVISLSIILIVVILFKEMTDKNKVSFDYDQLLTYVKAYENMAEQKSKNQHEHNNQLSYIRGMVEAKDPDNEIISYIDKLLDNQKNIDDEKLLKELRFLPGGLKGFMHYKIINMKKSDIDVTVYVSDELKKKDNWDLYKQYENEISHILGVYLDNAREASIKADKKYIIIDVLYNKDMLTFSISNTYKEVIDLDKIDKAKYSTKGKNRGYGLSLVKDIIDKSSHIEQTREIRGIYFIQNLIIKK